MKLFNVPPNISWNMKYKLPGHLEKLADVSIFNQERFMDKYRQTYPINASWELQLADSYCSRTNNLNTIMLLSSKLWERKDRITTVNGRTCLWYKPVSIMWHRWTMFVRDRLHVSRFFIHWQESHFIWISLIRYWVGLELQRELR